MTYAISVANSIRVKTDDEDEFFEYLHEMVDDAKSHDMDTFFVEADAE